ncbi:GmrSD restriction endonuclease domain-containing protein [Chromohalobacter israelensis]
MTHYLPAEEPVNGLNNDFTEESDAPLGPEEAPKFSEAVLHASDWTVETIVAQLRRRNIDINPRFQRRDAWDLGKKSRFIESIILGFPVPQIVLAEKKGERGKYLVLDGKQRLLSLLQYTGNAEGPRNAFGLSALDVRPDLARKKFSHLEADPDLEGDLNAFNNYTVRTVIIRNWPDTEFLHLVFLRLNTGSVKLSPQELRQALFPGEFSNFADDWAADSRQLQALLGRSSADPRMRDVELLVRSLSFHYFLNDYRGRMKEFLDYSTGKMNDEWSDMEHSIRSAVDQFASACETIINIFGRERAARKADSKSFNRAIFDVLIFYAFDEKIRAGMQGNPEEVVGVYNETVQQSDFVDAIESDTAGIPNTFSRLDIWGSKLQEAVGLSFNLPRLENKQIRFEGFWG